MNYNTYPLTQPFLPQPYPKRQDYPYLTSHLTPQGISSQAQHYPIYLNSQYPTFQQTSPQFALYQPSPYQPNPYPFIQPARAPIQPNYPAPSNNIYQGIVYQSPSNMPASMNLSSSSTPTPYPNEQTIAINYESSPDLYTSQDYTANQMSVSHVTQVQEKTFDPTQEAKKIENQIKNHFPLYTYFLYAGLILSGIGLGLNFLMSGGFFYKIFKTCLFTVFMKACLSALKAKYSLNWKRLDVLLTFSFFLIVQCLFVFLSYQVLMRAYYGYGYGYTSQEELFAFTILFVVNLILAYYARSLHKLKND